MFPLKTLLLAGVTFLAALPLCAANVYYVSNAGNDANGGKSTDEAWATVGRANAARLVPGDTVKFEAGGIWREQLLPQTGDVFAKIVYTAYGTGNKPLFLGSLAMNLPEQWTDLGANRWATASGSFPIDVGSLNFNHPSYIANSSFTRNLSGWRLDGPAAATVTIGRDNADFTSAPASAVLRLAAGNAAAGDVVLVHEHLSFSKGVTYRLRLRARASTPFGLMIPRLVSQGNPQAAGEGVAISWPKQVTQQWEIFTAEFTPRADANDARLEFALGAGGPERALWMDDITLTEFTGHASMIANPSFAQDLEGWSLQATGNAAAKLRREIAAYDTAPACAGLTVTAKTETASDLQLVTKHLRVVAGRRYRLSLRTRATADFTLARPRLVDAASPTREIGPGKAETTSVTHDWATVFAEFTAVTGSENASLVFDLGTCVPRGATVFFDDVNFKEVYDHPSVDTTLQNANIAVRKRNQADLAGQDQFWYDAENRRVIVWSKDNPAKLHETIECALSRYMCNIVGRSNIIVDGLAFWNGAKDCVQLDRADNIVVTNCDLRFIGGGYTAAPGSTIRFGNAFQLWNTVSNATITENYVLNIYDAGISNQGLSVNHQRRLYYRYNTLLACHYSFELWDRPVGSTMHDVYFENNLCRDAGASFSYGQRRDQGRASHLLLALTTATSSKVVVRNNLFDSSVRFLIWRTPDLLDNFKDWDIDYNTYRLGPGGVASWGGKAFGPGDWAAYQEASGKDAHSVLR